MKVNIRKLMPLLVLVGGLGAGGYLLVGKPRPQVTVPTGAPLPSVEVVHLRPGVQSLGVKTQGTVQPALEIDLVAQVGGKVEQVAEFFTEGGFFDADATLVQLERQDFRHDVTRARAAVADARQLLAIERGRVRQAKREWRDLNDSDANALFLRKPQLASALAAVDAAVAAQGQAELALKRTRIGAPFDGRVMKTFVDIGQFVTPGTPVARIHATDRLEVRLPLSDRQLALLNLSLHYRDGVVGDGTPAVILNGRFAGKVWQWRGWVSRTEASIDSRSRVLYVVVEIPDPFVREPGSERPPLIVGQFVQASIPGRELEGVISVPRAALRSEDVLWLLDDEDRLYIEPVQVLQYGEESVVVRAKSTGELRVVTSPLNLAIPGMKVALSVHQDPEV